MGEGGCASPPGFFLALRATAVAVEEAGGSCSSLLLGGGSSAPAGNRIEPERRWQQAAVHQVRSLRQWSLLALVWHY